LRITLLYQKKQRANPLRSFLVNPPRTEDPQDPSQKGALLLLVKAVDPAVRLLLRQTYRPSSVPRHCDCGHNCSIALALLVLKLSPPHKALFHEKLRWFGQTQHVW
jgi:hypothetical protein